MILSIYLQTERERERPDFQKIEFGYCEILVEFNGFFFFWAYHSHGMGKSVIKYKATN